MAWVDYDELAAVYDRDRAVPLEALEPWRVALAAYLPPASGLPVLDLGAGTGLFAVAIAQWFGTGVVAVEPSEGMRRHARATRAHPRVAYVGGLGEQLPLRDGCCDSAWLSTSSPLPSSRAAKSSMYCTWAETSSGVHWSIGTSLTGAGAPR